MLGKLVLLPLLFFASCTPDSETDGKFIARSAAAIKIVSTATDASSDVTAVTLSDNQTVTLFAILVDDQGEYLDVAHVDWSSSSNLGTFSVSAGTSTVYRPNNGAGTDTITATHALVGSDSMTTNVTYTVTDVNGLVLWLKADSDMVTSGAEQVSEWTDSSSSGKDAIQDGVAGDSLKPRLISNALNSLPVVRFDGVSETMLGSSVVSGAIARTVFVVFRPITFPNIYSVPFDLSQSAAGPGSNYALTTEVGIRVVGYRSFTTAINIIGQVSLLTARNSVNDNVTNTEVFLDGLALAESSSNSGVLNTSSSGYTVGADALGNNNCNCDIAEIIVYEEELSDPNRILVENYLTTKWGL